MQTANAAGRSHDCLHCSFLRNPAVAYPYGYISVLGHGGDRLIRKSARDPHFAVPSVTGKGARLFCKLAGGSRATGSDWARECEACDGPLREDRRSSTKEVTDTGDAAGADRRG